MSDETKESGFSSFFNKAKNSMKSSILESNIESIYKKENKEFTLYQYNEAFSEYVYGSFTSENELVIYGENPIKDYSIILDEDTNTAYYIVGMSSTTVSVEYNDSTYTRPATKLTLDKNVEEVKVIKAGKKFYIYKGK